MKKTPLLFVLILALFAQHSFAQKNTWVIDGNGSYDKVNFNSNNANSVSTHPPISLTNWSANIRVGYHFTDHILAGILGGYGIQQNIYEALNYVGTGAQYVDFVNKNKSWDFGVYGRYTKWIGKHLFIYSQLSVTKYGNDISRQFLTDYYNLPVSAGSPSGLDGNGWVVDLSPVIGVNIFRGYGLHMDIGGINYNQFNSETNKIGELNITLGQRFTFGVQKIIGWKKNQLKNTNTGEAIGK